jgi:hypothetical protein
MVWVMTTVGEALAVTAETGARAIGDDRGAAAMGQTVVYRAYVDVMTLFVLAVAGQLGTDDGQAVTVMICMV